jgi:crotonobetainyl-CoA:carnitine CoA-transferase CaiB-like acyl-CoA transferase
MAARPKPLDGIRVLDLTRLLPGPMATLHLADLGADVIKIEDPGLGDYARTMGAKRVATSPFFLAINRNKSFVTLDLKNPSDHTTFLAMVRASHCVVEGFRPGVMAKLGLGYERLIQENPALVMCSISGYGQSGPFRDRAGHDINYAGYTGVSEQTVGSDGTPSLWGLQVADLLGGAQSAVIGILAALIDARASGKGRFVDISMTDAVFAHNVMGIAAVNATGHSAQPGADLLTGGVPCYNVYRTADDRFLAVGALEAKFWDDLCDALDRADLKPAHWSRGQQVGGASARQVKAELDQIFRTRSLDEWTRVFANTDCCVTPILKTEEALAHPLFLERGMVVEQEDPVEGRMRTAALPIAFSDAFFEVEALAKVRGGDQDAVLARLGIRADPTAS